jgi:hypothetical protein
MDAQFKYKSNPQFDSFVIKINLLFTAIFTIELSINLFANWPFKFFQNGWNILDLVIVAMSLIDLGPLNIPEWLVRLMRAFRIVRLFGRVPELTKMITAITTSLFPMMNAFIILIIVLSICENPCLVSDEAVSCVLSFPDLPQMRS